MEKLSLKNRYSRLNVARKIRTQVAIPACRALLISSGWRVMIAAMPPPNAYTAQINARTSAKEPNTSTTMPPIPRRSRVPYIPPPISRPLHSTTFGSVGRSAAFSARRSFILGSAFRLDNFGDKASLRTGAALHKGLRFVYKCIRQRVSADVANGERLPFSLQHKINAALEVSNASRRHCAPDAHPLAQRRTLQSLQFCNRMVVSLAFSIAEPCQKTERRYDDKNSYAKLYLFLHADTPTPPQPAKVLLLAQLKNSSTCFEGHSRCPNRPLGACPRVQSFVMPASTSRNRTTPFSPA